VKQKLFLPQLAMSPTNSGLLAGGKGGYPHE